MRVLSVLAVTGIAASATLGYWWTESHDRAATTAASQTADSVGASMTASLQRDLDFEALLEQRVATEPNLTNRELSAWFSGMDLPHRYPGTVGLWFVERVSAAELPAFRSRMLADPEAGQPDGLGPIFPPGSRASYCLSSLGVQLSPLPMPSGTDLCAPTWPATGRTPLASVLDAMAGRGGTVVLSYPSLVDAYQSSGRPVPMWMTNALKGLFLVISPVYAGGSTPLTAALRRTSFLGWMVGTFTSNTLITQALGQSHGIAVSAYTVTAGQPVQIGSVGTTHFRHSTFTTQLGTEPVFMLKVQVPKGGDPLLTGILLSLLGAIVSGVPLVLGLHLGRSRERALRMVDERTGDLRYQAEHDPLTGLANRAMLQHLADQMLAQAELNGASVTATFIDLDDFKEVNDTLGHRTGDRLLQVVGTRLPTAVAHAGVVGRLGGDEFLVLSRAVDSEDPASTARKVLAALVEPVEVMEPSDSTMAIPISASIGVASARGGTSEDLIRDADIALHDAKNNARGSFSLFRPCMQEAIQERLGIARDLRRSLEEGNLYVVYQPIADIESGQLKSVEALVRWNHPTRGLVPPGQFIPIAEQTGLIARVGSFVLDEACRQAGGWARAGKSVGVSVNASPLQMQNPAFALEVGQVLDRHGLDPRLLTVEITESVLMNETDRACQTIADLHAMGVRLAIDDFGTGYSSLAYLQKFPIDALKIDRSFVLSAVETEESRSLIDAFVQIGQALRLEVVAEGIEDLAQLRLLAERGCRWGQGFLLSRPLTDVQMGNLLEAGSILPGRASLADRLN